MIKNKKTGQLIVLVILIFIVFAFILLSFVNIAVDVSNDNYDFLTSQKMCIIEDFKNVNSYENCVITDSEVGITVILNAKGPFGISNELVCYFDNNKHFISSEFIEPKIVKIYELYPIIMVILEIIFIITASVFTEKYSE